MTDPDELSRLALNPLPWPLDDITFAAAQLQQEFPTSPKDRVFTAVNSAAPFVLPAEGRVKLMSRARDFLRTPA
ncbi:MAG: hypothetical protein Q7S40_34245 [Opitutaceae bacterium]|nr:hypothetical protein [Opitutaceae bacterium]